MKTFYIGRLQDFDPDEDAWEYEFGSDADTWDEAGFKDCSFIAGLDNNDAGNMGLLDLNLKPGQLVKAHLVLEKII